MTTPLEIVPGLDTPTARHIAGNDDDAVHHAKPGLSRLRHRGIDHDPKNYGPGMDDGLQDVKN